MPKYRFIGDPNDNFSGPDVIDWQGFSVARDGWTEIPDEYAAKLAGNTHFEMKAQKASEPAPEASDADPVTARGAAAKAAGKARNVPPAYRAKPEAALWLAGYDGEAA